MEHAAYTYSFSNGKIRATHVDTRVIVEASIVALRRQYETTKQLPAPFDTRRAMEILGCWDNDRRHARKIKVTSE